MTVRRLVWEPDSLVAPDELERTVQTYTGGKGGVSILANGTLLFVISRASDVEDARLLLDEAKRHVNFSVVPMKGGGFLVTFNEAVAVFVSDREFFQRREEILSRLGDLVFPGEKFDMPGAAPQDHALVGLYARGKLQRDAHFFSFYKRV